MLGVWFPLDRQFTCTGKGVKIYSANQEIGNGLHDNLKGYLKVLSV